MLPDGCTKLKIVIFRVTRTNRCVNSPQPFANSMSATHIPDMTNPRVTIWYDGACPLCLAEISLIQRLDAKKGRIGLVNLMGDGTCPLDRDEMLARFHAQEANGPLLNGAAAFGAMWRHVTPFQPLGWLALFPPALWVMNKCYGLFLRFRPRLQALMQKR
jgi:predicted DCC family thiol-disulfide oxidoreductase YuxK